MANFDEFYQQARNWAKKNTRYFMEQEDSVINSERFLEGYYNLPENFFDKSDNFERLFETLEQYYILEQYINKGTIVL